MVPSYSVLCGVIKLKSFNMVVICDSQKPSSKIQTKISFTTQSTRPVRLADHRVLNFMLYLTNTIFSVQTKQLKKIGTCEPPEGRKRKRDTLGDKGRPQATAGDRRPGKPEGHGG